MLIDDTANDFPTVVLTCHFARASSVAVPKYPDGSSKSNPYDKWRGRGIEVGEESMQRTLTKVSLTLSEVLDRLDSHLRPKELLQTADVPAVASSLEVPIKIAGITSIILVCHGLRAILHSYNYVATHKQSNQRLLCCCVDENEGGRGTIMAAY